MCELSDPSVDKQSPPICSHGTVRPGQARISDVGRLTPQPYTDTDTDTETETETETDMYKGGRSYPKGRAAATPNTPRP